MLPKMAQTSKTSGETNFFLGADFDEFCRSLPEAAPAEAFGVTWSRLEWSALGLLYDGCYKDAFQALQSAPDRQSRSKLLPATAVIMSAVSTNPHRYGDSFLQELKSEMRTVLVAFGPGGPGYRAGDAHAITISLLDLLVRAYKSGKWDNPSQALTLYESLEREVAKGQKASVALLGIGLYVALMAGVSRLGRGVPAEERSARGGGVAFLQQSLREAVQRHSALCRRPVKFLSEAIAAFSEVWVDTEKARAFGAPTTPLETSTPRPPLTFETLPALFVGQSRVLQTVKEVFDCVRMQVLPRNKPIVLWFFGLSGHGKSSLARHIAQCLHNVEDPERAGKFVSLHMPNFCSRESAYSLIDPPAAHVGEGILLSKLQNGNDNAVVLLDEFDKVENQTINDIWLSAFQKDGMLRSLKNYERSVSTTRTVFIITSNTCQETLEADRVEYLNAVARRDKATAEAFARKWEDMTTAAVRKMYGDPLINRVDKMIVFLPYTLEERKEYVRRQLESLSKHSRDVRQREVKFLPSVVDFLAASVQQFHSQDITAELAPLLYRAEQQGWRKVVVCSVMGLDGDRLDVLPLDRGGETASSSSAATPEKVSLLIPPPATAAAKASTLVPTPPSSQAFSAKDIHLETSKRPTDLMLEIEALREIIKQKDIEIDTLKNTIHSLEVALAIAVIMLLACVTVLSLFISLKIILTCGLLVVTAAFLLMKNFMTVMWHVLRGMWRLLGPKWFVVIVLCVGLRLYLKMNDVGC